jgi:hypothetical protein
MPKPKQHQDKADHCKRLLCTIVDEFSDWKAIVAFYSAMHLVEKLRAYVGEHSTSHDDRDAFVRKNHAKLYNAYHQLFNASMRGTKPELPLPFPPLMSKRSSSILICSRSSSMWTPRRKNERHLLLDS